MAVRNKCRIWDTPVVQGTGRLLPYHSPAIRHNGSFHIDTASANRMQPACMYQDRNSGQTSSLRDQCRLPRYHNNLRSTPPKCCLYANFAQWFHDGRLGFTSKQENLSSIVNTEGCCEHACQRCIEKEVYRARRISRSESPGGDVRSSY